MKSNGDHFGVGIISGSIWGSFQGWGSFRGRDHFGGCTGPPRPRAQTLPAKRTGGSGDENDFHRERDDLVQGSFFLLQGVAVRDLIIGTSRS